MSIKFAHSVGTSTTATKTPLTPTCTTLITAASLKRLALKCMELSAPVELNKSLPGYALASAIHELIGVTPNAGGTTSPVVE